MSILSFLGLIPKAVVVEDVPPPSLTRLLKHVADGAYPEAGKLVLSVGDDNRERLIHSFSLRDEAIALAQQWVRSCSGSSISHTFLGACMIRHAWKIRGSARASSVSAHAWQPFWNGLDNAAAPLLEAARLDAATADPFAWLILAEVGKGGDRDLVDTYLAQATARVPLHWPTYYKYFMATTEKWVAATRRCFALPRKARKGRRAAACSTA